MIKVVGFDLDNTLYNQQSFEFEVFEEIANLVEKEFNIDKTNYLNSLKELYFKGVKSKTFDIAMQSLNKNLPSNWEEFVKNRLLPTYRGFRAKNIFLYDEAKNFLDNLKEQNYNLALITNGNSLVQNNKLDALNLKSYFDLILISDDFNPPRRKPDTYMFKKALEYFNIKPNQMVYIGDDLVRDRASQEVGIKFIDINSISFRDIKF
jgi:putative hydrolase of the HAD superfamily